MLTIELFGFMAERHNVEAQIISFFEKFDPQIDGQIMFYEIEPKNFQGESTKVIKIIASDRRVVKKLRRSDFFKLDILKEVNVGLFHYIVVKKADRQTG